MTQEQRTYLEAQRERYRKDLVENVMPFWMKHGIDKVHGGVYTCVDRDGTLMDTTKSCWCQGRCGFICAYAYNNIEKNPEWLAASKSCIDFIENHCIDTDGHMFFTVTEDGKPVQKRRYVFSECFAIIAMAEYALATGEKQWADRALESRLRLSLGAARTCVELQNSVAVIIFAAEKRGECLLFDFVFDSLNALFAVGKKIKITLFIEKLD